MGDIFVFAFTAALNPTLLAASTLMMLLPNPAKLMLGYLLGALITSISLGVVIVYALEGSDIVATTKHTLSPAATTTLGALALTVAFMLARAGGGRGAERWRIGKRPGTPPRWQRALGKGSPRVAFAVGALLTLPGASYLIGLSRIDKHHYSTAATVLLIVVFNVIMLALLEVSLLCFVFAPEWTPRAIDRAKAWMGHHGRLVAVRALTVLGVMLVVKGIVEFLAQG